MFFKATYAEGENTAHSGGHAAALRSQSVRCQISPLCRKYANVAQTDGLYYQRSAASRVSHLHMNT